MDPLASSPTSSPSFQPRSTSMAQHSHTHGQYAPADHRQPSPTPRTRSSTESSATKASVMRRDSLQHANGDGPEEVVPTTFDENALRVLIEMDCGVNCLLDRIKQGMASAREAAVFLSKRAALEGDLGRNMHKLAVATTSAYAANECKAGSFAVAWESAMHLHETIAENRLKLSVQLNQMSEELSTLAKEVDKNRKQVKDTHTGYERNLLESESLQEKAKQRFEAVQDELERFLVAKEGESMKEARMQVHPPGGSGGRKGGIGIGSALVKGLKGKGPAAMQRQEEDVRQRMSGAGDAYNKIIGDTQALRAEYFNFQLPRTLRSLKELSDEIDTAMQFHLSRYAYLLESSLLSDAVTLVPKEQSDGLGLKAIMEGIDNRADFKAYVQNYRVVHQGYSKGPKREGPAELGFSTPIAPYTPHTPTNHGYASQQNLPARGHSDIGTRTFAVDLVEQMERDGVEVPKIVVKCCEAVERWGLDIQGIYRLSGTQTEMRRLRDLMDKDIESVNLNADEWTSDPNNVAGVLKMWLRDLPDPLMTRELQGGFLEAAKNDNDRLRHIRLHERVNDLPDANYSTLKYLMGHLYKVVEHQKENAMTTHNIAVIFGPTLFGPPILVQSPMPNGNGPGTAGIGDMGLQIKAIETILDRYIEIFVEE